MQLEPVWGGTEDSAPPLRAAALVALARAEGASSLPILVDAMADPAKDVRIAAAVALGAVGTEGAGLVLRLKVRLGDKDPDVLSECLGGLLAVDPEENLPLVAEFLDPGNAAACEAAAMALGKSRLPEALDPLKACWQRSHSAELRQHILLAIAILRRPDAIDYLMELVASEAEPTAIAPCRHSDLQGRPASARTDRGARPGAGKPDAPGRVRSRLRARASMMDARGRRPMFEPGEAREQPGR